MGKGNLVNYVPIYKAAPPLLRALWCIAIMLK